MMARNKNKESKAVGLTQESRTSKPLVDSYDSNKDPVLVDSELNELVHPSGKVPSENVPEDTPIIKGWIDGVELLIQDKDFQVDHPQSHRIMSAVLNMLKSAKDHLGDK